MYIRFYLYHFINSNIPNCSWCTFTYWTRLHKDKPNPIKNHAHASKTDTHISTYTHTYIYSEKHLPNLNNGKSRTHKSSESSIYLTLILSCGGYTARDSGWDFQWRHELHPLLSTIPIGYNLPLVQPSKILTAKKLERSLEKVQGAHIIHIEVDHKCTSISTDWRVNYFWRFVCCQNTFILTKAPYLREKKFISGF